MKSINRITIFIKRILSNKLYLAMLFSLIVLSIIYICIPSKKKSAEIRVGIYSEDTSSYYDSFWSELSSFTSIYTFYEADSKEMLIQSVESGKAECGFYIPQDFFTNYINGNSGYEITEYNTASTILGSSISETVFSFIFKASANGILHLAYGDESQNAVLDSRLDSYIHGDIIFQIEDFNSKRYVETETVHPINIPILQLSCILIVFAGLLGLLSFLQDNEKGYYIALKKSDRLNIKLTSIIGAIIPSLLTGIICCMISFADISLILTLLLYACSVIAFDFIPGALIKKSSSLLKLLPVIMIIMCYATMIHYGTFS